MRAWAPRRSASATVAALRAPWRSESAITPATTAAASSTPTPASSVRRRRLVRRWRPRLTLAGGPALEEGALELVQLGVVLAAQSSAAASLAPR